MTNLNEYEIRYCGADGQVLAVVPARCADDQWAHEAAMENFADEFARYEILRAGVCIESGTHFP